MREMNRAPDTIERYRAQGYETYDLTPEAMKLEMLDYEKRSAAMKKKLDAIRADIISGKIKITDFVAKGSCN